MKFKVKRRVEIKNINQGILMICNSDYCHHSFWVKPGTSEKEVICPNCWQTTAKQFYNPCKAVLEMLKPYQLPEKYYILKTL